jgi:hypothetical protein
MTEQEWLLATDPGPMLAFQQGWAGERQLRLFALACCCRIARLLTDQRSVQVLLVADRFLAGSASWEELGTAGAAARRAYENALQRQDNAAFAATMLAAADPYQAAQAAASHAAYAVAHERAGSTGSAAELHEKFLGALAEEKAWQAATLCHILGNPFRPYPAPASWPALVVDLAQQFYEGADVRLVLHDALLDSGHAELAEHFRAEAWHPKGCWVLDLLVGKK